MAVLIEVRDGKTVWLANGCIDVVNLPGRVFKPDDPYSMPSSCKPVDLAVAVDIRGANVCRRGLISRDQDLLPRSLHSILSGVFPISKPITIDKGFPLCAHRYFFPPIPVNITGAHVMATPTSIAIGEDVSMPLFSL